MRSTCYLLILSALIAACGETKDTTRTVDDTGISPDPGPDCSTTVDRVSPLDGATDHYYLDPVVFVLSEPDPTAMVDAPFAGEMEVSEDGLTLTYTPDEPLEASTDYTVTLDYCRGRPTIEFSTSEFGAPLEASTDLEGAVYTLSFTGGDMVIGENAGELMSAIFRWPIMVKVQEVEGAYLNVLAAIGKSGPGPVEQNTCARTLEVDHIPTGDLPYMAATFEDQLFGANGGLLRFDSFDFGATISADGSAIGGLRYEAVLGVDEIVALLSEFGDVDSVCNLASNLDIPCEPCSTDADLSCIRVAAEHIPGARIDTTLVPIAEAGTHPDCEPDE